MSDNLKQKALDLAKAYMMLDEAEQAYKDAFHENTQANKAALDANERLKSASKNKVFAENNLGKAQAAFDQNVVARQCCGIPSECTRACVPRGKHVAAVAIREEVAKMGNLNPGQREQLMRAINNV